MLRTSREPAEVWVLRLSAITMATRPRCFERATAARTCSQNTSVVRAFCNPAIEPAITPVYQTKAIGLAIIPRRFDQALPAPSFPRPDARQRRVKGKLNLILEIKVSAWHEGKQRRQVGGKLIPQISLNQIM